MIRAANASRFDVINMHCGYGKTVQVGSATLARRVLRRVATQPSLGLDQREKGVPKTLCLLPFPHEVLDECLTPPQIVLWRFLGIGPDANRNLDSLLKGQCVRVVDVANVIPPVLDFCGLAHRRNRTRFPLKCLVFPVNILLPRKDGFGFNLHGLRLRESLVPLLCSEVPPDSRERHEKQSAVEGVFFQEPPNEVARKETHEHERTEYERGNRGVPTRIERPACTVPSTGHRKLMVRVLGRTNKRCPRGHLSQPVASHQRAKCSRLRVPASKSPSSGKWRVPSRSSSHSRPLPANGSAEIDLHIVELDSMMKIMHFQCVISTFIGE